MRVPAAEFRALDLEVHAFLADAPLQDVSAIDLPGGGSDRTVSDVRTLLSRDGLRTKTIPERILFSIRRWLGRLFGWVRGKGEYSTE